MKLLMKLLNCTPKRLESPSWHELSMGFRVLFYSTRKQIDSPWSSRETHKLYRRISPIGNPSGSIVPVLEQWTDEGRTVNREQLLAIIHKLRAYRRYKHALEVSQWMTDRRYIQLSKGEMAIRLDLISHVHGLEQAEKYFDNISEQAKGLHAYGALLNCYVRHSDVEKAEAHLQKMRDLGIANSALSYNVMLKLYSRVGQHEKLDILMQEMEDKGVPWDKFTFSTRMSAYADASDIDGMVKTLNEMEEDPNIVMDWTCYSVAANGYIKVGLIENALEMLKKLEKLSSGSRDAFEFLLTLYASTGRKDELYRIWNLFKSSQKIFNSAYMSMLSSLLKLDDIEGAENIIEEWKSSGSTFDFRVLNLLITAYAKRGLIGKAETLIQNSVEKGQKPLASTWDALATGYIENGQVSKATETLKKAILVSQPGWKPNRETLVACLEFLKGQGDIKGAEEFVKSLGSPGPFSTDVCERLSIYIADGDSMNANEANLRISSD